MEGQLTKAALIDSYLKIRAQTEELCEPLLVEDYVIQGNEDVSPPKWHLAHTTWFFETFLLKKFNSNYQSYNPLFEYLYNSYYYQLGEVYPRKKRGSLARPSVEEIYKYRKTIDEIFIEYLNNHSSNKKFETIKHITELGLHHEQQHQELLLMDIKYNFSLDESFPIYFQQHLPLQKDVDPIEFILLEEKVMEIGHEKPSFAFDNEKPLHRQIISPFSIASRLSTNGEYLSFIEDHGYSEPQWWLSNGWDEVCKNAWRSPLYWRKINTEWYEFTLSGLKKLDLLKPVTHISYYEADAFARWQNKRLPTEFEWEYAVKKLSNSLEGNFLENKYYHPCGIKNQSVLHQALGDVWEWTSSAYLPYPGFKPFKENLSEYNGKFMDNQKILRGGSCITPQSHMRITYRNYYPPNKRWLFSGVRLASDII